MAWPVLVSSSGLSLVLSLFNLLPAPPLDGGRIAEALLGRRACSLLGLITAGLTLSAGLYAVARGYGAALFCAGGLPLPGAGPRAALAHVLHGQAGLFLR